MRFDSVISRNFGPEFVELLSGCFGLIGSTTEVAKVGGCAGDSIGITSIFLIGVAAAATAAATSVATIRVIGVIAVIGVGVIAVVFFDAADIASVLVALIGSDAFITPDVFPENVKGDTGDGNY